MPDAANVAAPTFEAAARLTLALRTCSFLGKAFSNFLDRRVCRFFRARTKTRLALRTRGVSRTNLADPIEQKQNNALRSCQGQAFRQWSGRSRMPCCSVPRQNGQSAFCLATSCGLTSWLDGQRVYPKGDFRGSEAQPLLKNPGSIAAVAFEPARYG